MVQHIRPGKTKLKIVPRDGEIEITLNINIAIDGKLTAVSDSAEVVVVDDDKNEPMIPEFTSGHKLRFGKSY